MRLYKTIVVIKFTEYLAKVGIKKRVTPCLIVWRVSLHKNVESSYNVKETHTTIIKWSNHVKKRR